MSKKGFVVLLMVAVAVGLFPLFLSFNGGNQISDLGQHYVQNGVEETGAQNIVASIVVTYRGLDTLGEVTILFLVASIISFFLSIAKDDRMENRTLKSVTEVLTTSSQALVPIIITVGAYILVNGHLTPGGGFQGGAVIATGILLIFLANPKHQLNHTIIHWVESVSGMAFVAIGVLGVLMMDQGGFLSNKILSLGTPGELFSAGAIPLINVFLGLKVGTELSNVLGIYVESQNEK